MNHIFSSDETPKERSNMMASLDALDVDISINPNMFGTNIAMNGDEFVKCNRCGFSGTDVRVAGCGCCFHARCVVISNSTPLAACPSCARPSSGLVLFPMSFREIDEARKHSQSLPTNRKSKKRKGAPGDGELEGKGYISERRTGRWTTEEMALCDKLIAKFETGELPVGNGVKLNEFLGSMLKSKQSRLTKKMKNAKLSARTFQRTSGGILDFNEARIFSEIEDCFFQSVQDPQERAEIRFHMQREWREQFSQFCVAIGQPLDADSWLTSVEEMDRRASQAKDAARMAKRKLMMGFALRTDTKNPDHGVFIERTVAEHRLTEGAQGISEDDINEQNEMLELLAEEAKAGLHADINGKSSLLHSAPFLAKTISYIERHNIPFEHVDLWVPSFVPNDDPSGAPSNCRLCFAGSATADQTVGPDGKSDKSLLPEDQFNLYAFGDYSQKFSFDVGCGLPGRVYESGRPTWEQSVHNAPHHHFERCGGALQWGIKTVLGIPIASPNVGRVVVILYSLKDREKDQDMVGRLSDEFTRLMPSPKWKLVVDVGEPEDSNNLVQAVPVAGESRNFNQGSVELSDSVINLDRSLSGESKDHRIDEIVSLLGEFMPSDPSSPLAPYIQGFMSLRLLLLRPSRSPEDEETVRTMLESFTSYSQGGRSRSDIGLMLARDFMFLSQARSQQQQFQQQQHPGAFFSFGQGMANSNPSPALPEYASLDDPMSAALAPIAVGDSISIISN